MDRHNRKPRRALIALFVLLLFTPVSGEQFTKLHGSAAYISYSGATTGTYRVVKSGTLTFTTGGGTWTITTNKRISVKMTGRAGGAGGRSAINNGSGDGAGGGGSGAYNSIGETVTLQPGVSYTLTVGNGGAASINGGETSFRIAASTYYLRLGGGITGDNDGAGAGGAGGLALTGTNSVAGAAGGAAGIPGANGSNDVVAGGGGGGGGDGNFGGVGSTGGNGGNSGQAGEVPATDGGGRGGNGGGTYGYGGGGGGSYSSLGDGTYSTGRAGGSGFFTITIL